MQPYWWSAQGNSNVLHIVTKQQLRQYNLKAFEKHFENQSREIKRRWQKLQERTAPENDFGELMIEMFERTLSIGMGGKYSLRLD